MQPSVLSYAGCRLRLAFCWVAVGLGTLPAPTSVRAAELVLSDFNGTGFNYTFDGFTQTLGPTSVRLRDPLNSSGGGGVGVGLLNLSSFANARFDIDLSVNSGNSASNFVMELIDVNGNSGKWSMNVNGLPLAVPSSVVSARTLANQEPGIGNWQNFDLSRVTTWQVLGDYGGAPIDLSFDRIAISGDVVAPPPYPGAEANAPWRAVAAARIDANRKADLNVRVTDAAGLPVPGARVHAQMQEHEFGFGTAVDAFRVTNTAPENITYQNKIQELFNYATIENSLKWPPWEGEWGSRFGRQGAIAAIDRLNSQGIDVRGHTLVWPGIDNLPSDLKTLLQTAPLTAAEQQTVRDRIAAHIVEITAATNGKLVAWDVLNEPRANHDVQDALSEGDAAMATWFQLAAAHAPGVQRFINEYNILASGGGTNTFEQNSYFNTIAQIRQNGGDIQGIGFQSHFSESSLTGPTQVWEILDRFQQFGVNLQVTEFDFATSNEQLQAQFTRDFMTAVFAHEGITDFIQWGFWEGAHWRPEAAMFRNDWSLKPNGQAFLDLVFGEWWTDEQITAALNGLAEVRGFKGDYLVTASAQGISVDATAVLTGDESTVDIVLPFLVGDYNGDLRVDAADYTVWRDSLGSTTLLSADGDNNGVVDAGDLAVWRDRFGASVAPGAAAANVPEPASLLTAAFAAAAVVAAARRQQRARFWP